jgi:nucleoid-associated protein YgaU
VPGDLPALVRKEASTVDQFDNLKAKYQPAINLAKEKGVRLKNVHLQDGKLFVKGDAPNEQIKNDVWNKIKEIDSTFSDLTCDLSIDSSLKPPARTYTVAKGDTLWKIAEKHYGNGAQYKKIVAANNIADENKIHPGEVFVIPD